VHRRPGLGESPGTGVSYGPLAPGAAGGGSGSAYTDEQIEQLGREGKAMPKPGGGYWLPIARYADVTAAVAAYRELAPRQREGVYRWITLRARLLKAEHLLPQGWGGTEPGGRS